MQVVYEAPIMERLRDLAAEAVVTRRTIHRVYLNGEEMAELRAWLKETGYPIADDVRVATVLGMTIEMEH